MHNIWTILVVVASCGTLLSSALSINEKLLTAKSHPILSFDETSSDGGDNEESLFYRADDSIDSQGEESSQPSKDSDEALDFLLREILDTRNDSSVDDLARCKSYRSQIDYVCLTMFQERFKVKVVESVQLDSSSSIQTRYNFDDSALHSNDNLHRKQALMQENIPTIQQICCEFRQTYLRCLIPSVNLVCGMNEFNSVFDQVRGLSEICSRFASKSSRKCRRRYRPSRNQQQQQQKESAAAQTQEDANSTTVIMA